MILRSGEQIITAWAEHASGPGWSNRVVWVLIHDVAAGTYRVRGLQPHEQPHDVAVLFAVSATVSSEMAAAVAAVMAGAKSPR